MSGTDPMLPKKAKPRGQYIEGGPGNWSTYAQANKSSNHALATPNHGQFLWSPDGCAIRPEGYAQNAVPILADPAPEMSLPKSQTKSRSGGNINIPLKPAKKHEGLKDRKPNLCRRCYEAGEQSLELSRKNAVALALCICIAFIPISVIFFQFEKEPHVLPLDSRLAGFWGQRSCGPVKINEEPEKDSMDWWRVKERDKVQRLVYWDGVQSVLVMPNKHEKDPVYGPGPLPDQFTQKSKIIWVITAYNPNNTRQSNRLNTLRTNELRQDLRKLPRTSAFEISNVQGSVMDPEEPWKEVSFQVGYYGAIRTKDILGGPDIANYTMAMCKKYRQMAMYKYVVAPSGAFRIVVPCGSQYRDLASCAVLAQALPRAKNRTKIQAIYEHGKTSKKSPTKKP